MRIELEIAPLDLDQTLGCGQTFRWRRMIDGSWRGPLDEQLVTLSVHGKKLSAEAVPGGRRVRDLVRTHLRADDDIAQIQRSLARDPILKRGMEGVRGLRIVKMEEWECLVSFVLATYANIPRISKMIENLSALYGSPVTETVRAFPTRERLSTVSKGSLAKCGLGYRAGYLHELCRVVDDDFIDDLKRLPYEGLREKLKGLPGVGDKVADCVCLFGFGRLEAFPIDVWMERALERLYRRKGPYNRLRTFAAERFGKYAGYAQEYMYFNERSKAAGGSCMFSHE